MREATPVTWVKATMPGWAALGTAPKAPAIRLQIAAPERAPWTSRNSMARASRVATRWRAMDSPFTWMDMITPRNRKDGISAQNVTPKSSSRPHASCGSPIQGACKTLSMS